jgi:hypothetical protein
MIMKLKTGSHIKFIHPKKKTLFNGKIISYDSKWVYVLYDDAQGERVIATSSSQILGEAR